MGSISNQARAEKFIAMFTEKAVSSFGLQGEMVKEQWLSYHDGHQEVYLYAVIEDGAGDEYELMHDIVFYDPNEPDYDQVERHMGLFDLTHEEALEQLAAVRIPLPKDDTCPPTPRNTGRIGSAMPK